MTPTPRPLYIFDLDGTLALIDHRRGILEERKDPHRWRDFFAACVRDQPNTPVIQTMANLRLTAEVQIWSGRSDEVWDETVAWLQEHTPLLKHDIESMLTMRAAGDYTPDEELKAQWLESLSPGDRGRLLAVFDDRDKVVAMWRARGVPCFQVAPGGF